MLTHCARCVIAAIEGGVGALPAAVISSGAVEVDNEEKNREGEGLRRH